MKTYKQRTDDVLKKVRVIKNRRKKVWITTITSCCVCLLSLNVAFTFFQGALVGGNKTGDAAPENGGAVASSSSAAAQYSNEDNGEFEFFPETSSGELDTEDAGMEGSDSSEEEAESSEDSKETDDEDPSMEQEEN